MALLAVGALLIALGLFSGSVLVIAPFALVPVSAGAALWVLFPILCVTGYALIAAGSEGGTLRRSSVLLSACLLALALAAALGVVLNAAGLVPPVTSALSLWYVMGVAGLLGTLGIAPHSRPLATA